MMNPSRLFLSLMFAGLLTACEHNKSARDVVAQCQQVYQKAGQETEANLAAEALQGYREPHVPSLTAILIPHQARKPRKPEHCDDILMLDRRMPE